jgi:hypothetical protein
VWRRSDSARGGLVGSVALGTLTALLLPVIALGVGVAPAAAAVTSTLPRLAHTVSPRTTPVSWGIASVAPGIDRLNVGGVATVTSVSCGAPGNCAAGGYYTDGSGHAQAFVISEINGSWRAAEEVPRTSALNVGGNAIVNSVSCAAVDDCVAVGSYEDVAGHEQAFITTDSRNTWGVATDVPGLATLAPQLGATLTSVSCTSVGDCSIGGDVYPSDVAFVDTESDGVWGTASEVPGAPPGFGPQQNHVSCATAGNCAFSENASVDSAPDGYLEDMGVVALETNGTWDTAVVMPNAPALQAQGSTVNSISCGSGGDCVAGGAYVTPTGSAEAFVVTASDGTWGRAIEVPGTRWLNSLGDAAVTAVSCSGARDCTAVGYYRRPGKVFQAFVVNETDGTWGTAVRIPGLETLDVGGESSLNSVSCSTAGNCAAGGYYLDGLSYTKADVISEANGSWGNATKVSGLPAFDPPVNPNELFGNQMDTFVTSVSCAANGACAAGGSFVDHSDGTEAFVVNSPPAPTVTRLSPTRASSGTEVAISGTNLSDVTTVMFGTVSARVVRSVSSTQVDVTVPDGTGTVNVMVSAAGGSSRTVRADRFTYT